MGSVDNFTKYRLTYIHCCKISNERNIIAALVHTVIAAGEVPFQARNAVLPEIWNGRLLRSGLACRFVERAGRIVTAA